MQFQKCFKKNRAAIINHSAFKINLLLDRAFFLAFEAYHKDSINSSSPLLLQWKCRISSLCATQMHIKWQPSTLSPNWPGGKTREKLRQSQQLFFCFATDKLTLTLQIAFSGFHRRERRVPVVVLQERCEFRNNVLRRRYKAKIDTRAAHYTVLQIYSNPWSTPASHVTRY